MLHLINKHHRDDDISFKEETHEYFFKGEKIPTSVTSFIHMFFSNFNASEQAENIIKKKCKNETYERYKNMTKQEIINKWNEDSKKASSYGTKLHADLESFFNLQDPSILEFKNYKGYQKNYKEYDYFLTFLADKHLESLKPYRTEWMIYSNSLGIAGSIDMLFQSKINENEFVIYDWKRSKEIKYTNNYSHGKGPVVSLDDCNYNHYCLQLNMYKYILETYYNMIVVDMYLLVLHPNYSNYVQIQVPVMKEYIDNLIHFRKKQLDLNL